MFIGYLLSDCHFSRRWACGACCHFSLVKLFVTLWTVAGQAPLCMGFSGRAYWSSLLFLSPGDLPNSGSEPVQFFTTDSTWEALWAYISEYNKTAWLSFPLGRQVHWTNKWDGGGGEWDVWYVSDLCLREKWRRKIRNGRDVDLRLFASLEEQLTMLRTAQSFLCRTGS